MKQLDINDIMRILPHQYPFLLVDRITDWEKSSHITGYKHITFNEPCFQGHFPGKPVMPGVLTIEALAQVSGVLALLSVEEDVPRQQLFLLAGVDKVRYRKPMQPGDRMDMRCDVLHAKSRIWKFKTTCHVEGELACSAELMIASQV